MTISTTNTMYESFFTQVDWMGWNFYYEASVSMNVNYEIGIFSKQIKTFIKENHYLHFYSTLS